MERHFGHDFSSVRVHADSLAAESADAVDARAYTVGSDIVFGRNEYCPESRQGKSLLAHELSHVVQDQDGARDPHPVLRRAAKSAKTWAGTYVADPYYAGRIRGHNGIVTGYGARIDITFKADPIVDADKIAFVQTARSVRDGKPSTGSGMSKEERSKEERSEEERSEEERSEEKRSEEKRRTVESRSIPADKPDAGLHIDQSPESRSPLYGNYPQSQKTTLSEADPASHVTRIGWHYPDSSGNLINKDAWMYDEPSLTSGDNYTPVAQTGEWGQRFEAAALAISGVQAGTYYGSVQWGWSKSPSETNPRILDFTTSSATEPSATEPSPTFLEAARLWNASKTSQGAPSIALPIHGLQTVSATQLWDSPDRKKKIATLPKGTPLAQMREMSIFSREFWRWARVVVTSGQHAGKTGWVLEADLSRPSPLVSVPVW